MRSHSISISKSGYENEISNIQSQFNNLVWLNIIK